MSSKPACRVKVAVRLRPALKPEENEQKDPVITSISDSELEIWNWRDTEQSIHFDFDACFDQRASQRSIHERCVRPLLSHVLNGQNASVFAYGPTGTGKTFTMLGTDEQPGVIPRSLNHIFQVIGSERQKQDAHCHGNSWSYAVSFSYLEIYQEKIFDLLEPKNRDLPIREDRMRNIFIPSLAERPISDFNEFAKYFIPASKNRTTAATKLNSRSSRSHSILLLRVVKERTEGSKKHTQTGKLYLIDLAGSENNKKTGNRGIRLKESGAINTSLFVLGQVVDALNQRLPRVPYRDSKLTRLLQDSLGGSAHACMITNIAPEEENYMDTYTTLHFAAKSKQIVNRPVARETTENVRVASRKRTLSDGDGGIETDDLPPAKTRAIEDGGRVVANGDILQPLMERQETFEASVHQRLQSLEETLLRRLDQASKKEPKTPTSKKLLNEVKDMRRELSNMTHREKGIEVEVKHDRRSTFTLTDPNRPCPPLALVKPMPVGENSENQESSMNTDDDRSTDRQRKHRKQRNRPRPVKFVKVVDTSNSQRSESVETETKENRWQLTLDPEFQEKHRSEILAVLNGGSVKQLKSLQSVGEKRAQLIHSWRQAFGSFTKVEDLYRVKGLPQRAVDNILGVSALYPPIT
ncbi:kinesin-like protein KIF22 [Diadema antillarum]|uniref:kinesin-like protein KIF22 n=1 Tax=Diadema antillarum TaxID=105358 RepID=UPI003A89DD36